MDRNYTRRNIRAGIMLACFIVALGFVHIIRTDKWVAIIPKMSFTFASTITSVDEVLDRWNNRSLGEALRNNDPQLDYLVRELEHKGYISSQKKN